MQVPKEYQSAVDRLTYKERKELERKYELFNLTTDDRIMWFFKERSGLDTEFPE